MFTRPFLSVAALCISTHLFLLQIVAAETEEKKSSRFAWEQTEKTLELFDGENLVFRYHLAPGPLPEGTDPLYARSGYIHPLCLPDGRELTGDFPKSHLHQRGIFFTWVNVTVGETKVDFWNLAKGTGRVRHGELGEMAASAEDATVRLTRVHEGKLAGKFQPVLSDDWTITVTRREGSWTLEIDSIQRVITTAPVVLRKYHYGGFAYRANPELGKIAGYLTDRTADRLAGNGQPARWIRYGGKLADRSAWITFLSHPDNLRSPQPMRLHPKMPYFCFCPVIAGEYSFPANRPLRSRYRILVGSEKLTPAEIEREWAAFSQSGPAPMPE